MAEWLQNPLVVIGIAIAAMFFGYFFGLFEGRGQGYKKRQKEETEDKILTPLAEPLPPASPPAPSDETPVLDVSMAPDGELRLKVDGKRLEPLSLGAEQRKRLVAILTNMRPWLEAQKSAPPARPIPASTPSLASKLNPAPSPVPKPAPPPTDDDDEPAPAPQSIVAQIDSVLQARLARTPLAEKGVRLQESLDGGVIVWVGIDKYGGIDDVPDDEIKSALRAAIAEWEKKFTPGL